MNHASAVFERWHAHGLRLTGKSTNYLEKEVNFDNKFDSLSTMPKALEELYSMLAMIYSSGSHHSHHLQ